MNAERRESCPEEKPSLLDSELSQTLRAIAAAKELAAQTGKKETTLTSILTHALSDELKQLREKEESLIQPEPTFAQENRIITRRQSRRAAGVLMRKGHHAVRKHR